MKTLQSGICCLFFFAALLFATPGNANNIVEGKAETTVGQQLADMMNNPQLADYGISEAELYLQFTVRDNGELLLLAINTDNEYLIDFAKEKLHRQTVDLKEVTPNTVYNLRIKFELQ